MPRPAAPRPPHHGASSWLQPGARTQHHGARRAMAARAWLRLLAPAPSAIDGCRAHSAACLRLYLPALVLSRRRGKGGTPDAAQGHTPASTRHSTSPRAGRRRRPHPRPRPPAPTTTTTTTKNAAIQTPRQARQDRAHGAGRTSERPTWGSAQESGTTPRTPRAVSVTRSGSTKFMGPMARSPLHDMSSLKRPAPLLSAPANISGC
jgi:hypothetical protein